MKKPKMSKVVRSAAEECMVDVLQNSDDYTTLVEKAVSLHSDLFPVLGKNFCP